MFRHTLIAGVFLLVNVVGPASAACGFINGDPSYVELTQGAIASLLGGSEACVPTAGPPWTNQEFHTGAPSSLSGNIDDYKLGLTSPTDPTKQIGSYVISTTSGRGSHGQIAYTYAGSPPANFAYSVWGPEPATGYYDFCNGLALVVAVKVLPSTGGPVACH